MGISIARREGSLWGAVWDQIMRACLWGMSRNKSSAITRERNQPFTNDISMTSWVPLPEVEMRSKFCDLCQRFSSQPQVTWIVSDVQLPFLDLCLKPVSDRLLTSIHYKDTDTHSYLYYTSSHPARCKNSIPYSQFLRLRRICSEDNDLKTKV